MDSLKKYLQKVNHILKVLSCMLFTGVDCFTATYSKIRGQ